MTPEEQLKMLVDRQAILDCVTAYSRAVDRFDKELLLSCYHDDAIDDHMEFVSTPDKFADWVFDILDQMWESSAHILTNHSCEIDGDVAHCETYFHSAAMVKSEHPDRPTLRMRGGRYIDRMECRDGKWAIAARKVIIDWWGIPSRSDEIRPSNPAGRPARDRSDPSYERPLRIAPDRIGITTN